MQIKGCALDTICAPSYANVFMDHLERKYISPFLKGLPLIYLRSIDHSFFIWTGSKEQLIWNLDELNTRCDSIKFKYKISKTSTSFLVTEGYVNAEHPKSLKDSIPYSKAPRIKRICTTSKDFEHHCKELKQRFHEQGYNSELLDEHIETVEKLDRNEPIKGNKKCTPITTHIPLAITYNQFLPNINKIIRKKCTIT